MNKVFFYSPLIFFFKVLCFPSFHYESEAMYYHSTSMLLGKVQVSKTADLIVNNTVPHVLNSILFAVGRVGKTILA